jgi:outer membrane protein OmpA-like peptidoglycan-associated protein
LSRGILGAPRRLILSLPLILSAGPALAQQGPLELGAFGALASFAPSFDLRIGLAAGGRVAYHWQPGWAIEVELGAGRATIAGGGRNVPLVFAGLHARRDLDDRHTWYVLGGYARPSFRGTPPGRFSDDAVTLGLGRQTALGMRLALRTELHGLYTFSSGRSGRGAGHLLATVGLSFTPGRQTATDADSDGVSDRQDACRRTPAGAFVDPRGCPVDSDGDGRLDGLDRCPHTPPGVLTDSVGCPVDSDHDGVSDGVDQCPDSPVGTAVDLRGCSVRRDADGDGVDDAHDRCPRTARGTAVDDFGCQVLFRGARDSLVLDGVEFERGSSRLVPASFAILDEVAASLFAHPDVRVEIAGYADTTGSVTTNTQLSAARARAVLAYLLEHGVAVERMRAVTLEGKERNRGVVLHRVP